MDCKLGLSIDLWFLLGRISRYGYFNTLLFPCTPSDFRLFLKSPNICRYEHASEIILNYVNLSWLRIFSNFFLLIIHLRFSLAMFRFLSIQHFLPISCLATKKFWTCLSNTGIFNLFTFKLESPLVTYKKQEHQRIYNYRSFNLWYIDQDLSVINPHFNFLIWVQYVYIGVRYFCLISTKFVSRGLLVLRGFF